MTRQSTWHEFIVCKNNAFINKVEGKTQSLRFKNRNVDKVFVMLTLFITQCAHLWVHFYQDRVFVLIIYPWHLFWCPMSFLCEPPPPSFLSASLTPHFVCSKNEAERQKTSRYEHFNVFVSWQFIIPVWLQLHRLGPIRIIYCHSDVRWIHRDPEHQDGVSLKLQLHGI